MNGFSKSGNFDTGGLHSSSCSFANAASYKVPQAHNKAQSTPISPKVLPSDHQPSSTCGIETSWQVMRGYITYEVPVSCEVIWHFYMCSSAIFNAV